MQNALPDFRSGVEDNKDDGLRVARAWMWRYVNMPHGRRVCSWWELDDLLRVLFDDFEKAGAQGVDQVQLRKEVWGTICFGAFKGDWNVASKGERAFSVVGEDFQTVYSLHAWEVQLENAVTIAADVVGVERKRCF